MPTPVIGTTATLARRATDEILCKPDISSRAAAAAANVLIEFWAQEASAGRGATHGDRQWDATIMLLQEARQRFSSLYCQQSLVPR